MGFFKWDHFVSSSSGFRVVPRAAARRLHPKEGSHPRQPKWQPRPATSSPSSSSPSSPHTQRPALALALDAQIANLRSNRKYFQVHKAQKQQHQRRVFARLATLQIIDSQGLCAQRSLLRPPVRSPVPPSLPHYPHAPRLASTSYFGTILYYCIINGSRQLLILVVVVFIVVDVIQSTFSPSRL